jgi:hypothetical protein
VETHNECLLKPPLRAGTHPITTPLVKGSHVAKFKVKGGEGKATITTRTPWQDRRGRKNYAYITLSHPYYLFGINKMLGKS